MGPRVVVVDNYDSFVYNLVQYLGELGAVPVVVRNDALDVAGIAALAPNALLVSRAGAARRGGDLEGGDRRARRRRPARARRLPRPPVHRRGLRRHGRRRADADARQDLPHPPRRRRRPGRPAEPVRGHPLPLARRRRAQPAALPRGDGARGRRHGDGAAPPGATGRGGPVPPRVDPHHRRAPPARELPPASGLTGRAQPWPGAPPLLPGGGGPVLPVPGLVPVELATPTKIVTVARGRTTLPGSGDWFVTRPTWSVAGAGTSATR